METATKQIKLSELKPGMVLPYWSNSCNADHSDTVDYIKVTKTGRVQVFGHYRNPELHQKVKPLFNGAVKDRLITIE
jgi:hypothetical protein